jgi:hypothetical protein
MGESMSSLLVVCIDKNLYMCYNNYSRWQPIHLVDLTIWYTVYWLKAADSDQIIWAGEYYRAWFEHILDHYTLTSLILLFLLQIHIHIEILSSSRDQSLYKKYRSMIEIIALILKADNQRDDLLKICCVYNFKAVVWLPTVFAHKRFARV